MCSSKKRPTKAPSRTLIKATSSNYKAASGKIHWWLKRRWARLAAITAVESRYAALGYTGGNAQQNFVALRARAQTQGDWLEDGALRQREEETATSYFGGGSCRYGPAY
jgi:hypothetical protein